ncbi:MAG: restriction endonuclease subunit S [Crinalium sp.]
MGKDLYELPKGWVWVTLDSISLKITDGEHIRPKVTNDGIFFLSAKDVRDNGVVFDNTLFISEDDAKKFRQRCDPEAGDILVVSRGATVGRSCIVNTQKIFCLLGSVILIKIFEQISNKFISYLLKSPTIQQELISISGATAQQAIYLRDIKKVAIPLPSRAEQHRIVTEIEELFTKLDAGVELLKKVKAKLKRYRQTVLKAAVEGNLTKEWREANQGDLEPASVLRDRILKQRREKWEAEQLAKMQAQGKNPKDDSWKLKYKEPVAPDTSDLPKLPDGWCWATIEELLIKIQYGSSSKTNDDSRGVAVLRMGNILAGKIVIDDLKYLPHNHNEFPELLLEQGDLLFNRTNSFELVGKTAVYQGIPNPSSCASYLIRFRLNQNVQPYFISNYINSVFGRQWIKSVVSQQVGQANVNGTKLQALQVPLPPQKEQLIIKEEVERLSSVIDQLEKTIDANLKRAEKLRQTILKQAFEGKLVPQNPSDEPAEKLLERIKAEKAQREADKKTKPKANNKISKPRKTKSTATQLKLDFKEN